MTNNYCKAWITMAVGSKPVRVRMLLITTKVNVLQIIIIINFLSFQKQHTSWLAQNLSEIIQFSERR